jgi:hypothetical protein
MRRSDAAPGKNKLMVQDKINKKSYPGVAFFIAHWHGSILSLPYTHLAPQYVATGSKGDKI